MVDRVLVPLETLPLTPSGKINRRALAQLSLERDQLSEEQFVAPTTPDEEQLANIWAEVLGLEKVGIHDNFFDLGGHSLRLIQVQSKLQERLALMTDHPSVERGVPGPAETLLSPSGSVRSHDELRAVTVRWSKLDRLILDASIDHGVSDLAAMLVSADAIYCVCAVDSSQKMKGRLVK